MLQTSQDQWVYVASDGSYNAFDTQDNAEVAAEEIGLSREEFVVRLVSFLEEAEEDED